MDPLFRAAVGRYDVALLFLFFAFSVGLTRFLRAFNPVFPNIAPSFGFLVPYLEHSFSNYTLPALLRGARTYSYRLHFLLAFFMVK